MTAQYSAAPWPHYDTDEIAAVTAVLSSGKVNYWTGTQGREFEKEFAQYTGVRHAIWLANGTVALELAIRSLQLPAGAEVITTPRTFIASSSALVAQGLTPVFADIDPISGNITPETVAAVLTERTAAILVVHLGGWPADMPGLMALAAEHELFVIEDCAQAHGARINGQPVGSFGDVAAWSFCQDKIITTGGEGGMVATNDEARWRDMWQYKDHGKSYEAVYEREHPPGFRWLHEDFGTNWRGTEMQAAIGRLQYRKLDNWQQQREHNARTLAAILAHVPGLYVPLPGDNITHAFYRLYAYLDVQNLAAGWSRDRIIAEVMRRSGAPIFSGSCSEIYRELAFTRHNLAPAAPLAAAAELTETSLAFLVHPGLTPADMTIVGAALTEVMAEAYSGMTAEIEGNHA